MWYWYEIFVYEMFVWYWLEIFSVQNLLGGTNCFNPMLVSCFQGTNSLVCSLEWFQCFSSRLWLDFVSTVGNKEVSFATAAVFQIFLKQLLV